MEWRAIPGFPGYEASSNGDIRSSQPRYRIRPVELWLAELVGERIERRCELLEPWIVERHGRRAAYVSLSIDGQRSKQLVNRLVTLAFHGLPPEDKPDSCHRNHDSLDNRASNLRWGSHAENVAEQFSDEARERRAILEHNAGLLHYAGPCSGCPF